MTIGQDVADTVDRLMEAGVELARQRNAWRRAQRLRREAVAALRYEHMGHRYDLLADFCARQAQIVKEPKPGSLDFSDKWELRSPWWPRAEFYARQAVYWQRAAEQARRYEILLRPHHAEGAKP